MPIVLYKLCSEIPYTGATDDKRAFFLCSIFCLLHDSREPQRVAKNKHHKGYREDEARDLVEAFSSLKQTIIVDGQTWYRYFVPCFPFPHQVSFDFHHSDADWLLILKGAWVEGGIHYTFGLLILKETSDSDTSSNDGAHCVMQTQSPESWMLHQKRLKKSVCPRWIWYKNENFQIYKC